MVRIWGAVALVLGVAALYAPTAGHPWVEDDQVQISLNPAVTVGRPLADYFRDRATTSLRPDYNQEVYRPLRNLAFRAVARVAGVRPLAFGVANAALYLLMALGVWRLTAAATRDRSAAAWATALWVAAPLHVEPVAYYSALGDLLSGVLQLGALLAGVTALRAGARAAAWAVLATLLAAAAMFAKEMAVTTPALLVIAALAVGAPLRTRRAWLLLGAQGAVALGYLALRASVTGRVGQDPITAATLLAGLREAPILLVSYVWLCLLPIGHRALYVVTPTGLKLALALAAIAGVALGAWRLRRPVLAAGLAGFAVALLPVLHLVPLHADLNDRFALVPSVGLAVALADGLAALPARARRGAQLVLGALLLVCAAGTWVDERMWLSDAALWRYTVDREPAAPLGHANLSRVLADDEGRPAEALAEMERARALGFSNAALEARRARVLDELGRPDEAIAAARAALARDPSRDRSLGPLHAMYGDLLARAGRLDDAEEALAHARALAPDHPATALLEGRVAAARGRPADAVRAWTRLTARVPDPRYLALLARAQRAAGDAGAAAATERACRARAADPRWCD